MANKLADARRSLARAKESAQARLQELDDERREIKASLKSLDAALKALDKSSRKSTAARRLVIPDEPRDEVSDDVS
jgi:hypothetical protein